MRQAPQNDLSPQGTRNKGRGTKETAAPRGSRSTSAPCGTDQPEIYLLLEEWKAGRLDPVAVRLGELPADATEDMRRVAEHLRLLLGLRLAAGEPRPLPYAVRWAAEQLGWGRNYRRASRALLRLQEAGVIVYADSMPARGAQYRGTKLYAAPVLPAAATGPIEAAAIEVEPDLQPSVVLPDEPMMAGAEPVPAGDRDGLAATGDAAVEAGFSHDSDRNATIGCPVDRDVEEAERLARRHGWDDS